MVLIDWFCKQELANMIEPYGRKRAFGQCWIAFLLNFMQPWVPREFPEKVGSECAGSCVPACCLFHGGCSRAAFMLMLATKASWKTWKVMLQQIAQVCSKHVFLKAWVFHITSARSDRKIQEKLFNLIIMVDILVVHWESQAVLGKICQSVQQNFSKLVTSEEFRLFLCHKRVQPRPRTWSAPLRCTILSKQNLGLASHLSLFKNNLLWQATGAKAKIRSSYMCGRQRPRNVLGGNSTFPLLAFAKVLPRFSKGKPTPFLQQTCAEPEILTRLRTVTVLEYSFVHHTCCKRACTPAKKHRQDQFLQLSV